MLPDARSARPGAHHDAGVDEGGETLVRDEATDRLVGSAGLHPHRAQTEVARLPEHRQGLVGRNDDVHDGRHLGEGSQVRPAGISFDRGAARVHGEHPVPLGTKIAVDLVAVLGAVVGGADDRDGGGRVGEEGGEVGHGDQNAVCSPGIPGADFASDPGPGYRGAMRMRVAAVVVFLVVAACGGTAEPEPAPREPLVTPGLPVTITGADGVTSTVTDVSRIVSLSGDFSEIVWELGFDDQLVGVDLQSVYPQDVMRAKPKIGVEFRLLAEPILALEPTLVIGDVDATPRQVIDQVRGAGVPVVILPRYQGLDGAAEKIRAVGEVLGVADLAEAMAVRVEGEVAAAVTMAGDATTRPRVAVVYVATESTILLLAGNTVFEGVLDALGAEDVGPDAGVDGFVPLTPEAMAAAAPDIIITAERGFERLGGLEGFLALPGLAQTPAGRAGAVLVYEDLFLLGIGPRTGLLADQLVRDLHPELAG